MDIDLWTYEVNINSLKKAISPKTKAIMIAHTLWNAFDLDEVTKLCKENNLWLIEDNCDALWTKYNWQYTWSFWDISTFSFYPAHHITMWEWWALATNNPLLKKLINSYRDWWRDCRCPTWKDNTCNHRFNWQLWDLPKWFDHKYIYSRLWYNLKITDMQASIWLAQLEKLENFIEIRKKNFRYLHDLFTENKFYKYFILPVENEKIEASRFWFIITLKEKLPFNREELLIFLNENWIGTRLVFAWNYIKQPVFIDYVKKYRIIWNLKNSDYVMNNAFWIGVYPWLEKKDFDFVILKFKEFLNEK